MTEEKGYWTDPRTNPAPPYRGPERYLAHSQDELSELLILCKNGRLYDIEAWIADGKPLQVSLRAPRSSRRIKTVMAFALENGSFDLIRLFLCNGYQIGLEPSSPLNIALESRRWDLLELLFQWGADPHSADVWRIIDTYEREVFERFWNAGVDLTTEESMTDALSSSTRNRPLYGFVKNFRTRDSRIQRALDIALGVTICERNEKALRLCLWAGADSRRRIGDRYDQPEDDESGMTAIERAVSASTCEYLKPLGFDATTYPTGSLYEYVYDLDTLRSLVNIEPPEDWDAIARRFIERLAFSARLSVNFTSIWEIEAVFALGGRLGPLDRSFKRQLRQLLISLDECDAQHLVRLLANPENMDRQAFIDLIAHEKLALRFADAPTMAREFRANRDLPPRSQREAAGILENFICLVVSVRPSCPSRVLVCLRSVFRAGKDVLLHKSRSP
jgi:hypothetical protein